MKTKYIDKRGWKRVTRSTYSEKIITQNQTRYLIGLLSIHQVSEPLTVTIVDRDVCVVNVGYRWLTIMPENTHYSITVMYDQNWQALQYYIDVNFSHYLELGRARRQDLYLDVLVLPSGAHELVDKRDLKHALAQRKVTKAQFEFAHQTATKVMHIIDNNFHEFTKFCEECRQKMI